MHDHTMKMQEMHRGPDGLELPVAVEVTIRHDHGPISNMEDHDHPVTVAITQDGGEYVVDVPIHEGLTWSDDEPLTANDWVFTFDTIQEVGLGTNWQGGWRPFRVEED
jgi:hypothetical protein